MGSFLIQIPTLNDFPSTQLHHVIYIPTYTKHISKDLMTRKCRGHINIGHSNYESLLVTSDEIYLYSLETLMKGVASMLSLAWIILTLYWDNTEYKY